MSFSERISPLIGRWALAWYFLGAAWHRTEHWGATVQLMAMKDVPAAPALLALAILVLALGGLSLMLGFQTRHGAMFLFGFTVIATVVMHNFWMIHDSVGRAADFQIFAANVAIAGGLLLLVGMGPGPFALDNRFGKKKGR